MPSTITAPPSATESDVARWRRDLKAYCHEVLYIVDKQGVLCHFDYNRPQEIVAEKVAAQLKATGRIRVIILKARQEGMSTWVAGRFFRRATLYPNQNVKVVGDQTKRSAALFKIYDTFYRNLDEAHRPQKRYGTKSTELVFDGKNGGGLNSRISVETANDVDAGRGETVHCLHGSEVASWEYAEELWDGLASTLPDEGSEAFLESTAKGVGNFFHSFWVDAESGTSGWLAIFLPWWINPEYRTENFDRDEILATLSDWEARAYDTGIEWEGKRWKLDLAQLAWRRNKIRDVFRGDERKFRQEFPATAREAFLVSGNMFFDEEPLRAYEEACATIETKRFNLIHSHQTIFPAPSENGYLRMWYPPNAEQHNVIFADTATGQEISSKEIGEKGGRDFSCAYVYDKTRMALVASLHGRMAPEVFAEQLQFLGYFYANPIEGEDYRFPALIGVEKNHSSGETVLKWLRKAKYPNLFMQRREHSRRAQKPTDMYGWQTNVANRQRMLDELAMVIRDYALDIPDADLVRECFTFVRDETGKPQAQESCHDDRVITAAGALQMASFSQLRSRGKLVETLPYTTSQAGFWEG